MSASRAPGNHRRGCGDETLYGQLVARIMARSATGVASAVARGATATDSELQQHLQALSDDLWDALHPRGVSWIGFYLLDADAPLDRSARQGAMLLAARRDSPACSPIGLHGACGQAFLEESIRLIEDVELLGSGYIACDPRDRSEIVLPIYRKGRCIGVLDADSHELACFGQSDVHGLSAVLRAAGLLDGTPLVRANLLQEIAPTL